MEQKLRIYNTLGRKMEDFKSIRDKEVGLYTCGLTVYNYAHIGNLRTYIFEDILQRVLEWDGYKVKRVMNITDVGHLTSDADEGEDKLDKEARAEMKSPEEIALAYTKAFIEDLTKLNVEVPELLKPASQEIEAQLDLVKKLFEKGFAYETDGAVYFDTSKLADYGKLTGQKLSDKSVGSREEVVVDPEKRNPTDFALWFKLVGRFKNHLMHWPSPWGEGFPGWHLECSAISTKYLGQPFDIHTGGVDHIGVHHTNEIAQSEGAYGKPLANYWMHSEFLLIDGAKMAKSQGNFFTLKDIEKHDILPLAFRYLVLGAHYRTQMNFTWESMESAAIGLKNLYDSYYRLSEAAKGEKNRTAFSADAQKYLERFSEAINDDLNTPKALAVLQDTLRSPLAAGEKLTLIGKFDTVFALFNTSVKAKAGKIPEEVAELVKKREEARRNKQFVQSDAFRAEVEKLGYVIEDTPEGPVVRPK